MSAKFFVILMWVVLISVYGTTATAEICAWPDKFHEFCSSKPARHHADECRFLAHFAQALCHERFPDNINIGVMFLTDKKSVKAGQRLQLFVSPIPQCQSRVEGQTWFAWGSGQQSRRIGYL